MSTTETICALATPNGNASVAIIRLSGPQSLDIAKQVVKKSLQARYAHFSSFYDSYGQTLDQGIAIYFPAPHSFTGEDVVELQPHGNPHVCQQIINELIKKGARQAIAGEFSERAFINGKLDLVQLEAIADLISSGSQQAAKSAVQSMQGKFSDYVKAVLQQLIQVRTHIEASLDFADEDIETEARAAVQSKLLNLKQQVMDIFSEAEKGVQLQQGFTVVLTGSPNVGKSSLFNALCAEERAIVTNIPGTTRDVVSADLHLQGVPIRLLDTAGIREDAERIEKEGIARAQSALETADVILQIFEASTLDEKLSVDAQLPHTLFVANKSDLLIKKISFPKNVISISAKTGDGLNTLRQRICELLNIQPADQQAPFSARARHLRVLERCVDQIEAAQKHLASDAPLELAAEELRLAQQTLSEITGEFTPDDLLDYVFREFCIGK